MAKKTVKGVLIIKKIYKILHSVKLFVLIFALLTQLLSCALAEYDEVVLKSPSMPWGSLPVGGGGYVTGIVAGQNTMYLRTDVGGAYRYENARWVQMLFWVNEEDKGYYGVEGIAIDPTNDNIVYLVCGTDYFSSGRTVVMKSTDGGRTFPTVSNVSNLIRVHGNGPGRGNGERIAVDPTNPSIIYAGGRNNGSNVMIKSTNGGTTWSAVTSIDKTSAGRLGVNAIAVDRNGVAYASVSRNNNTTNVFRSTDKGATWTELHASLPKNLFVNRMKINPQGNLMITYTNNDDMGGGNARQFVYNTTTGVLQEIFIRTGGSGESQPVWEISWHPTDPNRMVASTAGHWRQQRWQGTSADVWGDHIWRSLDGGATWLQVNMNNMQKGGISWIQGAMHWSSSCVVDPTNPNRIHVVSGNGVFASDNIWAANPSVYFRPAGVEETVALDFISIPGGDNYSVIGDFTGFRHTNLTTYASVHNPMFPKNGTGIAYNPHNRNVLMRVGEYRATEPMAYYSLNAGTTWTLLPKMPSTENAEGYCAVTTVNSINRFLWSHGNNSYYSDNNGFSWTAITGINRQVYFQVDSVNPLTVYAAGNGRFYRSTDGGASFTQVGTLTSPATTINNAIRITHAPGVAGKLYYPSSGGLYVTTNGGTSWSRLPGVTYTAAVGLGKGEIDTSPHAIYIWGNVGASPRGIYRSVNDGQTWVRINDDQHQFGGTGNGNFIYGDMNVFGRVYMSTVGLGIIYGD
ncbi:MAG: hypothetical protein FWD47_11190 [Treponema sp.]|nr:hypothetical protein [Treponema sp.]